MGSVRLGFSIVIVAICMWAVSPVCADHWSVVEENVLRSLWIGSLPPLPKDISNKVADSLKAVNLGHRIFFDPRFSADGNISCATCHQPGRAFTDGLVDARGIGQVRAHTPSIIGVAYSPWFFRDGRSDSLWAQSLSPLENQVEHGSTRTHYAKVLYSDSKYRAAYEELFKPLPMLLDDERFPTVATPNSGPTVYAKIPNRKDNDKIVTPDMIWEKMKFEDRLVVNRIFINIGKVMAAYERLLLPGASKFDKYVEAVLNKDINAQTELFDEDEVAGLGIFIGKGNCVQCHNGPLLTNNDFHNTGVKSRYGAQTDKSRSEGILFVLSDPFNCFGAFSDAFLKSVQNLDLQKSMRRNLLEVLERPPSKI
jgi:cytochrome c peroxidase